MKEPYNISFISIVVLVFLLPIFFLPSSILPITMAKTALLSLAAIAAFLGFLFDTFKRGRIELPSAPILWSVLLIPLVYLISALLSGTPAISLFGYSIEVGTFAFMAVSFVLLFISSVVLSSRSRILKVYTALFLSLALVVVFSAVKIASLGTLLNFDSFLGNMGNTVGLWTDLAVIFGLLSVLSLFAIEMLRTRGFMKVFLYGLFVLSTALLVIINFSVVWYLTLAASIIIIVYFTSVERSFEGDEEKKKKPNLWPAGILLALSLLFVFNPKISSQGTIGDMVSSALHISNTDVRPSLSTTLDVSHSALIHSPILGSGPNTFDKDWFLYKPQAINSSSFWQTAFTSGFGFLPSQIATTGILGTLVWVLFLIALVMLAGKALKRAPATRPERFLVVSSGMGALFFIVASFMYAPSVTVLSLGFMFVGVFVAACASTGVIPVREVILSKNSLTNFVSVLVLILSAIGTLAFGVGVFQKTVSVYHFERALVLANTAGASSTDIETELSKAITFSPTDLYYSTLSQFELQEAQAIVQSKTGTPEKNSLAFQNYLEKSIEAAQSATTANPASYQNWLALGSLYSSLVPAPLSVSGAYESAQAAYAQAQKLNPLTPEVSLMMANLELNNKNETNARKDLQNAVTLKQDYADAYFLLSQIEASDNNLPKAIQAAKAGAVLSPGNAGVYFELGVLEYSAKDYSDAVTALTQALAIQTDYANAQYYLGLSLEALGRHAEAVAQFRALEKTNPGNADIQSVLNNLQAGRDPLYKAPAAPTKAPVTQGSH